jgi:hypothetical protein
MKVYLKFNKTDTVGYMCLLSWIDMFRDYDIILVCDLFNVSQDPIPELLSVVLNQSNKKIEIINTNYESSFQFNNLIPDPRYQKAAAANVTCFNHNKSDDYFWLVDADDTMFLTRNFDFLKLKIKEAEKLISDNHFDSLSLDFYRMQNDTWSFGICLINAKLDFNFIRNNLSDNDFISKDTRCLDICFDKLRRTNKLNLKTFIINNASFIHYVHKTRNLPYCLYHWEAGALNGKPVPEDFIIL